MADVAKWALLVTGAILIIALIMSLPFMEFVDAQQFSELINSLVSLAGGAFTFARGLINNFLTPFGRIALTGLLYWMIGKWAITVAVKMIIWVYHFIFK